MFNTLNVKFSFQKKFYQKIGPLKKKLVIYKKKKAKLMPTVGMGDALHVGL